jgi:hypothetical protein
MVSRFESGTERPDLATHQRYSALAPTEELRLRAATAYKALPLSDSIRHPAVVRRSPEEWHGRALDGAGVYRLLEEKYPAYPLLRLFGNAAKPLPVWAELAPAQQWADVEASLGQLDLSQPPPDVRTWRYWELCDPGARRSRGGTCDLLGRQGRHWGDGEGMSRPHQRKPCWRSPVRPCRDGEQPDLLPKRAAPTPPRTRARIGHRYPPMAGAGRTRPDTRQRPLTVVRTGQGPFVLVVDW